MRGRSLGLLVALAFIAATGGDDLYQQQYPGHSEGLAACSGNVEGTHCWRADEPRPTELCVERDPVSQMCLRIVSSNSVAALPERQTGHADVARSPGGAVVACDGTDPFCVPDGVHLVQGAAPAPAPHSCRVLMPCPALAFPWASS